jgi:hypothetical protein
VLDGVGVDQVPDGARVDPAQRVPSGRHKQVDDARIARHGHPVEAEEFPVEPDLRLGQPEFVAEVAYGHAGPRYEGADLLEVKHVAPFRELPGECTARRHRIVWENRRRRAAVIFRPT